MNIGSPHIPRNLYNKYITRIDEQYRINHYASEEAFVEAYMNVNDQAYFHVRTHEGKIQLCKGVTNPHVILTVDSETKLIRHGVLTDEDKTKVDLLSNYVSPILRSSDNESLDHRDLFVMMNNSNLRFAGGEFCWSEMRYFNNLNPFSKQYASSQIAEPVDGVMSAGRRGVYHGISERVYASHRGQLRFSYQNAMMRFRKQLDPVIMKVLNKAMLFDIQLYNELAVATPEEFLRLSQFLSIYQSYPYTNLSFSLIKEGVSFKEMVVQDLGSDPVHATFLNKLFRSNRIASGIKSSIKYTPIAECQTVQDWHRFNQAEKASSKWETSRTRNTANAVNGAIPGASNVVDWIRLGVVPRSYRDLRMMMVLREVDLKLDNKLYQINNIGFRLAYNEYMGLIPKTLARRKHGWITFARLISDSFNAIESAGYKMPTSLAKIALVTHRHHDVIVDYRAAQDVAAAALRHEQNKQEAKELEAVHYFGDMSLDGCLVRQIVTSGDLYEEGSAMRHCVGGYASRVAAGTSIIFSITKLDEPDTRSTVEFGVDRETSSMITIRQHWLAENQPVVDQHLLKAAQSIKMMLSGNDIKMSIINRCLASGRSSQYYVRAQNRNQLNEYITTHVAIPLKLGRLPAGAPPFYPAANNLAALQ
jgi:hypothetical protein